MKRILNKRGFLIAIGLMMMAGLLIGCQDEDKEENTKKSAASDNEKKEVQHEETDAVPEVTLVMENSGEMIIELYPNIAPNSVNNFISLVEDDFYDGLIFHRVIPGFMIQGGDPDGRGTGGPGYAIGGEFSSNDFENDLGHDRGVLSMARSEHPDSAGSQFFIMTSDSSQLDGDYAAFGKVTKGLDTADEIVESETNGQDKPEEDQVIESMTVDLKGYDVQDPVKTE